MTKLYIDADGCPVTQLAIEIAASFEIPSMIVCDYAHAFEESEGVDVCLCDKGKDSVDFAILKHVRPQDIVITQDYGLASLLLTKQVNVMSQNGLRYDRENIDELLAQRHYHAQLRKAQKHTPHMKKRTKAADEDFQEAFLLLCEEVCGWTNKQN